MPLGGGIDLKIALNVHDVNMDSLGDSVTLNVDFTKVFLLSKKNPRNCTLPIYVHKIKPSLADSDGTKFCRYLLYQILSESDRKI